MYQINNLKYKNILNIQTLKIPTNKVVGIMGESGCGKTTLLRMLNKMLSPDAGEILLNGKLLSNLNSVQLRRKVVMLPQSPALLGKNVRECMIKGLQLAGKTLISEAEILTYLEIVGLAQTVYDDVLNMSGGEKLRLALARTLALKPEIMLLDEPTAALDRQTENTIFQKIVELSKKRQQGIIMVTHSLELADSFCDEIITMSGGGDFA